MNVRQAHIVYNGVPLRLPLYCSIVYQEKRWVG